MASRTNYPKARGQKEGKKDKRPHSLAHHQHFFYRRSCHAQCFSGLFRLLHQSKGKAIIFLLPKGQHKNVCHGNKIVAQLSLTCWRHIQHAARGDALGCSSQRNPFHCTVCRERFNAHIYAGVRVSIVQQQGTDARDTVREEPERGKAYVLVLHCVRDAIRIPPRLSWDQE